MPFGTSRLDETILQRRLWTPAVLGSQLIFWFDAQNGPFTIATGVSQWNDISGQGRHITNATGANQPTISEGLINGLRAIAFNGSSQRLVSANFATTVNWTSFAVWRPNSVSGVQSIVDMDQDASGLTRESQDIRQNVTALESIAFSSGSTAFTDAAGTTLATNTNYLAVSVRGASAVEIWGNGSSNGSTATTSTNASPTVAVMLGAHQSSVVSSFFSGGIGEAGRISFDLSSEDRQKLEGYLAWRWGLVGNLPASHPFGNRPPTIGD